MATSDVDQKTLSKLASRFINVHPLLSNSLYQILGLSTTLARKLFRARKFRKLDTSRDTKSLSLYHHIIWLSREGLTILEVGVLPYTQENQYGSACLVLATKLRASFFHIFCLFHNDPPVSQFTIPHSAVRYGDPPLSPRQGNGQTRKGSMSTATTQNNLAKGTKFRDPIPSITSDASYITNPYAASGNGTAGTSPPSLHPSGNSPRSTSRPFDFLLPSLNFVPRTAAYFSTASDFAAQLLPGSHPLRLSVALEHSAFLWDCAHEHESARSLARRAIRDVYRAQEGMDDSEFEDAAELVAVLGRIMRRTSWDGTARGASDEKNNVHEKSLNGDSSGTQYAGLDGMEGDENLNPSAISHSAGHKTGKFDQDRKTSALNSSDAQLGSVATNGSIRPHEGPIRNPKYSGSESRISKGLQPNGIKPQIATNANQGDNVDELSRTNGLGAINNSGLLRDHYTQRSTSRTSSRTPPTDGGYRLFPGKPYETNGSGLYGRGGSGDLSDQYQKPRNRDVLNDTERSGSATPRAGGPVRTPDYGMRPR